MVNNVLKYHNPVDEDLFTDVSQDLNPWSYNSIEALSETGIIKGYSDGTYQPDGTITRAEMTVLATKIPVAALSTDPVMMPNSMPD